MSMLSLDEAERVIAAGVVRAAELSVPVNIAVLDAGANLKAFVRMDRALLGSIDIAMGKARTSALFQMNSEALFDFCKPGGTSFGLENSNGGLFVFAGGRPLVVGGGVVGAVGVSGGSVAQDDAIAQTAAAALSAAVV
ncbi:GlcG/HbpS family heme-binding protein [Micromonospora sp. CA-259024]|uniref:GlcG/HbpS family heme-binding protein n=1 Tax=Micromonospora sp. CA-259024 TaxID=3239965 RepID=UPI003D8A965E